MYLHLGQDTVVKMSEVVGIFDLETSTISKITREFLAKAEKSGKVINVIKEDKDDKYFYIVQRS